MGSDVDVADRDCWWDRRRSRCDVDSANDDSNDSDNNSDDDDDDDDHTEEEYRYTEPDNLHGVGRAPNPEVQTTSGCRTWSLLGWRAPSD